MHVQGTEIHIFAWGKQGLNCLPFWCLALTMGLLTGWEWLSLSDVISLLISDLSPLGEQWGPCPGTGTPQSWELPMHILDPASNKAGWAWKVCVCVWLLFWLQVLSLQAMHMLLWKVLLVTNIFLAKVQICQDWHFSAFHKWSKLQQTAIL